MQTGEISFSRIALLPGIELIQGKDVAHSFPLHRHAVFCIGIIEKGRRFISTANSGCFVNAGDIFVINPGQAHACLSPHGRPHSYMMLCIDKAVLNNISSESDKKGFQMRFNSTKISDSALFSRFRNLCDLLMTGESDNVKNSVFKKFISDLASNYGDFVDDREANENTAITIAKEFLEGNVTADINISNLSSACGLSPFHLTRSFKRYIGLTPHAYQLHGRIKRARQLLVKGMPIADVALESGFHDQSHFTNTFKRVMGITPCRYISSTQVI